MNWRGRHRGVGVGLAVLVACAAPTAAPAAGAIPAVISGRAVVARDGALTPGRAAAAVRRTLLRDGLMPSTLGCRRATALAGAPAAMRCTIEATDADEGARWKGKADITARATTLRLRYALIAVD